MGGSRQHDESNANRSRQTQAQHEPGPPADDSPPRLRLKYATINSRKTIGASHRQYEGPKTTVALIIMNANTVCITQNEIAERRGASSPPHHHRNVSNIQNSVNA